MNNSENYYKKLGLEKNASKEEIKKAYRALSMKHHPDKNNNSEESNKKFQEINEAYEILYDDQKRKNYDNMSNFKHFPNNSNTTQDIFNHIFNMTGGLNGFNGIRVNINGQEMNLGDHNVLFRRSSISKPTPIIRNIEVNLSEILEPQNIPIEIERWISENGSKTHEKETFYIQIPQGVDDNEILLLQDKGNIIIQGENNIKGDIKIFFKINNDTNYKRQGLNLILEHEISFKESLCGFSFNLKYINGKSYSLNNTKGTIIQNGQNKVIPNLGLTREINNCKTTGNLIIQFKINYPDLLSEEQVHKLSEIL